MVDHNVRHDITVNPRSVTVITLISLGYLVLSWLRCRLSARPAGIADAALQCAVLLVKNITQVFVCLFNLPGVLDHLRLYEGYLRNYKFNATVHMADLYNAEKHLFGIHFNVSTDDAERIL